MQKGSDDQASEQNPGVEKQFVYMMPSETLEEDEIDLWQLVLPIIRYKVQIILFLLLGLAVGFGYIKYKTQALQPEEQIATDHEQGKTELASLLDDRENIETRLFNAIEQISEGESTYRVVNAEILYTINDKPNSINTSNLDAFQSLTQEDIKNLPEDNSVILTVKKYTIQEMKKELLDLYERLIELEKRIILLDTHKYQQWIDTYRDQNNPDGYENREKTPAAPSKEELSLLEERELLKEKITALHHDLSYRVSINTSSDKVPWHIWQLIKKSAPLRKNAEQNQIIEISKAIEKINHEIIKSHFLISLANAGAEVQDEAYTSLFIGKFIPENTENGAKSKGVKNVNLKKTILISSFIGLFLGIFSVYLRVFIIQIRRNENVGKYRQEFVDALKSWKL